MSFWSHAPGCHVILNTLFQNPASSNQHYDGTSFSQSHFCNDKSHGTTNLSTTKLLVMSIRKMIVEKSSVQLCFNHIESLVLCPSADFFEYLHPHHFLLALYMTKCGTRVITSITSLRGK